MILLNIVRALKPLKGTNTFGFGLRPKIFTPSASAMAEDEKHLLSHLWKNSYLDVLEN